MLPVKVPNSNMVYKGPTPDIGDLECQRIKPGLIRSVWKPSDEERAYLAVGGHIELDIYTEPIPPIALNVTDEGANFLPFVESQLLTPAPPTTPRQAARLALVIAWNFLNAHRFNRRFERAYPCRRCGYRYDCPDDECHS